MTAINAAAPLALPAAPAFSTNSLNPILPFSKFFSITPDLPAPQKKKGDDDTNLAAVAIVPAPPKLLKPITLSNVEPQLDPPAATEQPTDVKLEKLEIPQAETSALPGPNEFAFAAKLTDSMPRQTVPQPESSLVAAGPTPLPQTQRPTPPTTASHANAVKPTELVPATDRRADTTQHRSDAPPAAEAAPSTPAQHEVNAQPTQTTTQNAMVRDMSSSSSLTSRTVESTPQVHAPERLAPLQAALENARPASPRLQDISIRVAGPEQNNASIRLVETGGEIRVAVHASDPRLADSLRGNIDQLTSRLNNNGMSAEVWKPAVVAPAARAEASSQDMPRERQSSPAQLWRESTSRDQSNDKQKRPDWAEEYELWT